MIITNIFDSSAIDTILYDTVSRKLSITFTSGKTYDYPNVPQKHVKGLIVADSAGKYFNQYIRQYSINK